MKKSSPPVSDGYLFYRHSLPVRVLHWLTVITLPILLMSGLNIFNAHTALYWGKSSYSGAPPLLVMGSRKGEGGKIAGVTMVLGHEFDTTGLLGVSRGADGEMEARGFPSWITLPGSRWLSMARRWHFFFAWGLVFIGFSYLGYSIFSRHLQHHLIPTRDDWRSVGKTLRDHLLLRHPVGEEAKRYNLLQKLAYLSVIFLLLPMVIVNGLAMSPGMDALLPGWIDLFGGRQSARTIHFIVTWLLVAFTAVHLFQVVVTGFLNNLRSMITGRYRITSEGKDE